MKFLKEHSKEIVINTVVVITYYIIAFLIIPNIPATSHIEIDLDSLLITLPLAVISVIMEVCQKHFRVWIIPDVIYCFLAFAISSESFHPYGVGVFFSYHRDVALIECLVLLVLLLLVQLIVKLLMNLVKTIKARVNRRD